MRLSGTTGTGAPRHRHLVVLDTVSAGDAFTAGYLSGVLDAVSPAMALHRGTVTGGSALACVGDWEGLPTRAELRSLEEHIAERLDALAARLDRLLDV